MTLQSIETLSPPQKNTLNLLTEGLGNVQIAQRCRISLDRVGGMLEDLYNALGIEPSLSKQEKRGLAINHCKKSSAGIALFEQTTPASLLEGLKPWQRQALTGIAQDRKVEDIAAEIGVTTDDVEMTLARFMVSAKVSTRDKATETLKQVMSIVSQPIEPARGYSSSGDRQASSQAQTPADPPKISAQPSNITLNERDQRINEILDLVEQGKSNDEIADKFNTTIGTINTTMSGLYRRFNLERQPGGSKKERRMLLVKHWRAFQANVTAPKNQGAEPQVSVTLEDPTVVIAPQAEIPAQSVSSESAPASADSKEEAVPAVDSVASAETAPQNNVECTLTVDEALDRIAAAQRVVPSERSLQRYCVEGRLVAQKTRTTLGSEWLINEASLMRFIEMEPLARESAEAVAVGSGGSVSLRPPTNAAEKKENRYQLARDLVIRTRNCTNFFIRRKLGMGGPEFKEVIQRLEDEGVVGKIGSGDRGSRQILIPQPQDVPGQDSYSAAEQARQSRSSLRTMFSDEEKIEKLQELLLVVGENSQLGQILDEVINDLERMEKMRQIIKLLKED